MPDPAEDLNVEGAMPSTLHVYRTLVLAERPLSVTELTDRTGNNRETIRLATTELLEAGAITDRYGREGDGRERHFEA